jgi:hypothetical protein
MSSANFTKRQRIEISHGLIRREVVALPGGWGGEVFARHRRKPTLPFSFPSAKSLIHLCPKGSETTPKTIPEVVSRQRSDLFPKTDSLRHQRNATFLDLDREKDIGAGKNPTALPVRFSEAEIDEFTPDLLLRLFPHPFLSFFREPLPDSPSVSKRNSGRPETVDFAEEPSL